MRTHTGNITAKKLKFGIIVGRFNEIVSAKLLDGAIDCLMRHDGVKENIDIFWVPGSFEIPAMARTLVETGKFDGIICLGAVIRGETPHFDYIAAEVTKGIAQVGLNSSIPVSYGVLTTDTVEQAIDRAGAKAGNKGWDATISAMEMIDIFKKVKKI
ncbi:6,7-dimethyl-8-ribityllumazine synthase [candidate division KSB1 bacterium]